MARMTDQEWVRFEAEQMGITLSDSDVDVILKKAKSDLSINLRDLLAGIRNLNEPERLAKLKRFEYEARKVTPVGS
jgi:hypothetical protein